MIQAEKPLEIIYTSTSYRTGTDTNAHVKTNVAKVEKNQLIYTQITCMAVYIYATYHTSLCLHFDNSLKIFALQEGIF